MCFEKMRTPFAVTYRFHWCGPCPQYEDTKEETTINADGTIVARRFDHHGAKGRFRVVERATAHVSPAAAERLYSRLMVLIRDHEGASPIIDDATHEIILDEPGLKVTLDGGLFDGEKYAEEIISSFLESVELDWESVLH